jgi:DNA/RNA endonuclease YhcR with UshA esterase domain
MERRLPIRALKVAAVLLATLGLVSLWFLARRTEVPIISVAEASAAANLAYVRIEGRCSRAPTYDPATGYLSFWIADPTGEIRVASYRAETRALLDQNRVPALEDRVSVAGSLRVKGDDASLTLNVPAEMIIQRSDPEPCALAELKTDHQLRRVHVRGQIRRLTEPYAGLTVLTLRDETGSADVVLSDDALALGGVTPTLTIGDVVDVVATVSDYRGEPQLVVASGADVIPKPDAASLFPHGSLRELSDADLGRWVLVRGTVSQVEPFSAGVKLLLDDGSGSLTALLWDDIYAAIKEQSGENSDLLPGCEVEVHGELTEYRGKLQLVPELAADVRILATPAPGDSVGLSPTQTPTVGGEATAAPTLMPSPTLGPSKTPAPTATPEPPLETSTLPPPSPTPRPSATPTLSPVSLGSIDADDLENEVTVEGTVVETASFSHGFKFTLDDGHGQIILLMWHDVFDDCWDRAEINLGARVRAVGEVTEYEAQLQIEPRFGGGVKVVTPASMTAPARAIGSLTAEDAGVRIQIEGEVVRTEGLPSAVKVFLRGTEPADHGEIAVFIWRNVLDRIPNNVGLGTPGSHVRVVGSVQVYRSNLEFVPVLPNDVTVLEIPDGSG